MCRCVSYRYLIPVWQKHPRVDVFHCLVGETGLEPSLGFQLWANLLLVIVTWHQRPPPETTSLDVLFLARVSLAVRETLPVDLLLLMC